MDTYEQRRKAELERVGFVINTLTPVQIDLIMEPSEGPENFYHDGELSKTQALANWKLRLQRSGLSLSQIQLAVKMNFGR